MVPESLGDRGDGSLDLALVRVALTVDELLRDRVRREEEVDRLGARVRKPRDLRPDRVGVRLDEERVRRPGADLEERRAGREALDRRARALERSLRRRQRVLRVERHGEEAADARAPRAPARRPRRAAPSTSSPRGRNGRAPRGKELLDSARLVLGETADGRAAADRGDRARGRPSCGRARWPRRSPCAAGAGLTRITSGSEKSR